MRNGSSEFLEALRHDRHPVVQTRKEYVEQSAGPGPIRRRPYAVACLRKKIVVSFHAGEMTNQHAMAVQRAFRLPGGAGCIDHHRRIVRGRIDRRKIGRGAGQLLGKAKRAFAGAIE